MLERIDPSRNCYQQNITQVVDHCKWVHDASSLRSIEQGNEMPELRRNSCRDCFSTFFKFITYPLVALYNFFMGLFTCCFTPSDPFEYLRRDPKAFIQEYKKAPIKMTNKVLDFIYDDPYKAAHSCFELIKSMDANSKSYKTFDLNGMFKSAFTVFNRLKNDKSLELIESLFTFYGTLSELAHKAGMRNPIMQAFSSISWSAVFGS
jgi:hypothetical protein